MTLRLIVTVLAILAMPVYGQAQSPNPPKPSKAAKPAKAAPAPPTTPAAAAQKVVKTISSDKAKTQSYCEIGKLGSQIEDAEQKKDLGRIDELNKKMDETATKLGPDYVALMATLEGIDPTSKEALEIGSALEALDKLCPK
jgi:hypothetical protein